tara:strand:- start:3019 stop:3645 length:627 start_codon:yes stop_codon:yes gene_type:complete
MNEVPEQWEMLREEAIAYATEILEGFIEAGDPMSISLRLDSFKVEYDRARHEKRGVDPGIARRAIQHLIDVATFPVKDEPETYDQDAFDKPMLFEAPLFQYKRSLGRPKTTDGATAVAYAVGAVAARFQIYRMKNDETSPNRDKPAPISACEVVAEANRMIGQAPRSYSGVRACMEREDGTSLTISEGKDRGEADRKVAIKMATTQKR